jgi:poly(A) polymerase
MKERWRLSNRDHKRLETLTSGPFPTPALRPSEQRAMLYLVGEEAWSDLVRLAMARSRAKIDGRAWLRLLGLPRRWPRPNLPISAGDLMAAGISAGPELGLRLRQAEDWWIACDFAPGRQELLQHVMAKG